MTVYEATIPGSALDHVWQIADPEREPEIHSVKVIARRRRGRGEAVTIRADRRQAESLASRLRELAGVEREVRAFGDGANAAVERACDTAAERIESALAEAEPMTRAEARGPYALEGDR